MEFPEYRYPDPRVEVLDPRFEPYLLGGCGCRTPLDRGPLG
ncbi:MAG: hypothetical protein KatS3mg115_1920 [Candidatus Poribacteria bacterium]|nr:MAG: hypothetical protein KatS3mg115_1920 [Candidatus Poribacteria bacterium]